MALLLTTLQRARDQIGFPADASDGALRTLARIVAGVSHAIGERCNAQLGIATYTERFQTAPNSTEIYVDNPTIRTVEALRYDPLGMQGSSSSFLNPGTDFVIGGDGACLILAASWPGFYPQPSHPFEITYTGGRAYETEKTVYNVVSSVGTITPASYKQDDLRVFKLDAWDPIGKLVTFRPDFGCFYPGDLVTLGAGNSILLGEVAKESVCNDLPNLETAALMQISYEYERVSSKTLGRNSSVSGAGTTVYTGEYKLLAEVVSRIVPFTLHHVRH